MGMRVVVFGLMLALLSACGQELDANSAPTAIASPTTDSLATLIAQQLPTQTASATLTPVSPSATPTLTATLTPVPPTQTETPSPMVTDTALPTAMPALTATLTLVPSMPTETPPPKVTDTALAPNASATKTSTLNRQILVTATPTLTPSVPTVPPTNTLPPTLTPEPASPTPYPTNTPRPTLTPEPASPTSELTAVAGADFDETGAIRDHYWLARPFPRDPTNQILDYPSRNYPYGTTAGGQFQTHHGMDFQNSLGTAILAVAPGTVFYAGNDLTTQFGPRNDFYGNLVVIQHDVFAPNGEPMYTLYGHMFRVEVEIGQRVDTNQKIGTVGSTGAALGSHLHLEVRLGDPFDYSNTYNPDLWVQPWPGYGTLAGRIFDRDGNRMYDVNIIVQPAEGPDRYTYSYADDDVNPDPYYAEHFTYGDLPAGSYQILVRLRGVLRYKGEVTIEAGQTAWLEIHVN